MVRDYVHAGCPPGHPIVPRGMAVRLNAPAVFRFTAQAGPPIQLYCARLMGRDGSRPQDVDKLAEGTLPQHRVGSLSLRPAGPEDLRKFFLNSMPLC